MRAAIASARFYRVPTERDAFVIDFGARLTISSVADLVTLLPQFTVT
jgi:hypothetical protein